MIVARGSELLFYSFGEHHPFNSERAEVFFENTVDNPGIIYIKPIQANRDEIGLFHTPDYIEFVFNASSKGIGYLDFGDTPAFKGAYEASAFVVGTTLYLLKQLINTEENYAFNPIGGLHHSMRDRAGGFCIFNDIGVAIEYLFQKGYTKILYIDIDAHHGDGVYYSFEMDNRLFIWDIHEDGRYLYPGTGKNNEIGKGPGEGTKVNINLPPGSGDKELLGYLSSLEGIFNRSKPEFVICQVGVDGLEGDPITHLKYTLKGYLEVIHKVKEWSLHYGKRKVLFLGGGGYNLNNISQGWSALIKTTIGS